MKPNGTIHWRTGSAEALSHEYGLLQAGRSERVADVVRDWLRSRPAGGEDAIAQARQPLEIAGSRGTLAVRLLSHNAVFLLSLEERPNELAVDKLRTLGLSPRKTEILGWLARGKSNPEIAAILRISVRTVHKHVENIYQDLGVDHRHAAMAKALAVLGPRS